MAIMCIFEGYFESEALNIEPRTVQCGDIVNLSILTFNGRSLDVSRVIHARSLLMRS